MTAHVLVADDDAGVRSGLARALRSLGMRPIEAASGAQALEQAGTGRPDAVLLDVHMPDGSGLEVLPRLLDLETAPAVVLMTGEADVGTAVAALRGGAADFLEKPIRPTELEQVLRRVLDGRSLGGRSEAAVELGSGAIVGRSPALRRVLDQVERVASTPRTTVLIQGESGVGKELVARLVHERSDRRDGPFVALNCAALSESLLEAELFGYEPGAFTGGSPRGRAGLVSAAEGGTLFLDEVGELAPELQAKLLRVLQERSYRRVGGDADRPMDARIVASTNRELAAEVERGAFREDLFYRLNVMALCVPPLRERRQDVAPLAVRFLGEFGQEFGKSFRGLTPASLERLEAHSWPGNVRELRNAIERAALLAPSADEDAPGRGEIRPEHLDLGESATSRATDTQELLPVENLSLRSVEKVVIARVLADTGGNRSAAARVLGVNRTTLYNKLRVYGIEA